MNKEFFVALELLEKEKGIPKEYMLEKIEAALLSAFKKEFGITVNTAITREKMEEAKKLLTAGKLSINEIAHATGFYDQSYFSKVFFAEYGVTPSEFRKDFEPNI